MRFLELFSFIGEGREAQQKQAQRPTEGQLTVQISQQGGPGEWECVASNVATSITASTHLLVIGRRRWDKWRYFMMHKHDLR